jgi:hypothetical protein
MPFAALPLLLVLAAPSHATDEQPSAPEKERPVRAFETLLGMGSHFGGFGGAVAYRPDRHFAASVGIGGFDGHVTFGATARYHPIGPLFLHLGASPLVYSADKVYYGPDLALGVDLVRTRVAFNASLGAALLGPMTVRKILPTFDLGVGVNFGRSPERRFDRDPGEDS